MTTDEVIEGSLWQVTIYAAFQRAKVYSEQATTADRKGLKVKLKQEIDEKVKQYIVPVEEPTHVANIVSIAQVVDKDWKSSLDGSSIPIGVVQKAFNLYLKLLWCLEKIPEPPHCPLDKVIIDKLPRKHRKSWTKIRDIETYKFLIQEVKKIAGSKRLSSWELENYESP